MPETPETLRIALVQMTSADSHAPNIAELERVAAEAAADGCAMLAMPEVAGLMNRHLVPDQSPLGDEANDPYITACREVAERHGLWIHTGSTPILRNGDSRFLNHSNLIDATGRIVAAYDKIHLFDIHPPGRDPILESRRYAPGRHTVLAETPWGPLAMSICYDLRFPQLYREYAQDGAAFLMIPSAFTVPTGKKHWAILLRARAIETGAFVIAAAQTGTHEDGRKTYGHAMVVAPSGKILADLGTKPGWRAVDLDLSAIEAARQEIPSLSHDRSYSRLPGRALD